MKGIRIVIEVDKIINYLDRKGGTTANDLERTFGYNPQEALLVVSQLNKQGIITSGENDYEIHKEKGAARRMWRLTERGKNSKNWPKKIEMIGKEYRMIPKAGMELINYILETLPALGIRGLDEAIEKLESQSPEVVELVRRAHIKILGDFSPEELRQLSEEINEIKHISHSKS